MRRDLFSSARAVVTALVLGSLGARAQADGGLPRGWFVGGSDPSSYTVEAQPGECSPRAAVLSSRPGIKPQGAVTVMQLFRADKYRGQRVRFSGQVRTTSVEGWAGLWLRVDGADKKTLAFDNMQRRALRGTTGCSKEEVVVDVAKEAEFIALGLLLDGEGSAELGTIALEAVDPAKVASTSLLPAPAVLTPVKDPREDVAIGRVESSWFGEKTIGGTLDEVGPGLWRWKGEGQVTFDGKTIVIEQGLAMPGLGAPTLSPLHGRFTLRREGEDTVIDGTWGTSVKSYPVSIRYSKQRVDMKWDFYERHLVPSYAPQLEPGCAYFANQPKNALSENDHLTLCGAVLSDTPPPVQTVVAFLWTGFKRFSAR